MVLMKHNSLKSDIFFNPIFVPGFSGSRFFWVRGPSPVSRVQGPDPGSGSRFQKQPWISCMSKLFFACKKYIIYGVRKKPPGKKPPGKMPSRKLPPGKLPPGNKPPKKIVSRKNAPRKNAPQENCPSENCHQEIVSLDFCCF